MDFAFAEGKSVNFLATALLLQLAAFATVLLDVPVARQIICFVYFTFIPGFVFLKILKLEKLDAVETVLFSVGLSVAFLMTAGILMNEFVYSLFCNLSTDTLMIFLSSPARLI